MTISSVATAFPKHHYSQEILALAQEPLGRSAEEARDPHRIYLHMGVESRYLSLPLEAYYDLDTWGKAITSGSRLPRNWDRK